MERIYENGHSKLANKIVIVSESFHGVTAVILSAAKDLCILLAQSRRYASP
jgi:hypothetical protein